MKLSGNIESYLEFYKTEEDQNKETKFYEVLLVLCVITLCLANCYAQKVISLGGFDIVLSGIIFPFTFLFLIIINESYGHQKCGRSVVAMLIGQFLFLFLLWKLSLVSSPPLTKNSIEINNSLKIVYGNFEQVILGSMLAVGFSFYFFSILNSWLKVKLCKYNPIIRFIISVATAKLILVSIAYSVNLWHIITLKQLIIICIHTWIIKMIIASIIIFISVPLVNFVKKIEKIDTFDLKISYNPFLLYSKKSKGLNLFKRIREL